MNISLSEHRSRIQHTLVPIYSSLNGFTVSICADYSECSAHSHSLSSPVSNYFNRNDVTKNCQQMFFTGIEHNFVSPYVSVWGERLIRMIKATEFRKVVIETSSNNSLCKTQKQKTRNFLFRSIFLVVQFCYHFPFPSHHLGINVFLSAFLQIHMECLLLFQTHIFEWVLRFGAKKGEHSLNIFLFFGWKTHVWNVRYRRTMLQQETKMAKKKTKIRIDWVFQFNGRMGDIYGNVKVVAEVEVEVEVDVEWICLWCGLNIISSH